MKNEKLSELGSRLLDLPQVIADLQSIILKKTQKYQEVTNEILNTEIALKNKINSKVDDAGKKVYSNADAREAAFIEITSSDLDLTELRDKTAAIQNEIQELKIGFERLSSEQKNTRSLLYFFANSSDHE
jgi:chromosome segregation ATPase